MRTDRLNFQSTHLQFDDLQNIDKLHERITTNYSACQPVSVSPKICPYAQQRTQRASEQVI
jgi:hypothetical protein